MRAIPSRKLTPTALIGSSRAYFSAIARMPAILAPRHSPRLQRERLAHRGQGTFLEGRGHETQLLGALDFCARDHAEPGACPANYGRSRIAGCNNDHRRK